MLRRPAPRALLLALAWLGLPGCGAPELPRPNVVFIIADDQGFDDFGFMGSEWVETPSLDRLAAEGVVFETAYNTGSYCKPSLNTLLTGLYPHQWRRRVEALGQERPELNEAFAIARVPTLPRLLAEYGYATFQAGKHWEGNFRAAGFAEGMADRFDPAVPHGHAAAEIGRETMVPVQRFLDANAAGPFFLFFAPMLPHVPHDAPPRYRAPYEGRGLADAAVGYYAGCTWLDEIAGRLLHLLEERGLTDNTLVVFLADNGWEQGPHDEPGDVVEALMGGARGKHSLHERGHRTPVVVRWPAALAPRRNAEALVSTVDLVPTVLDYAGVPAPAGLPGRSLRPLLEGREREGRAYLIGDAERLRRAGVDGIRGFRDLELRMDEVVPLVQAFHLRSRDWHYLRFEDEGRDVLYDLRGDPAETRDVAAEHPQEVARLRAEIERWRQETGGSPLPDPGVD